MYLHRFFRFWEVVASPETQIGSFTLEMGEADVQKKYFLCLAFLNRMQNIHIDKNDAQMGDE